MPERQEEVIKTENIINEQEIKTEFMKKKVKGLVIAAIGGAIAALSLTVLLGLIVASVRIQEYFGTFLVLIVAIIVGFYLIFGVANK